MLTFVLVRIASEVCPNCQRLSDLSYLFVRILDMLSG